MCGSETLNLCSEDEWRSYQFGTTWGWVINDRIFIFGWPTALRMTPKQRKEEKRREFLEKVILCTKTTDSLDVILLKKHLKWTKAQTNHTHTHTHTHVHTLTHFTYWALWSIFMISRWRNKSSDDDTESRTRQQNTNTHRHTQTHTDRHTKRHTDRHTKRHTHTHTNTHRHYFTRGHWFTVTLRYNDKPE